MSGHRIAPRLSPTIPLVLAVAFLATPAPGQTVTAAKGVSFKVLMTLTPPASRPGKPPEASILFGSASFANGMGRIDIDSSRGPVSFAKGDYFVIDSGHTVLIRPSVQTYAEIESPIQHTFTRMAAQLTNPQMGMSGLKVDMENLGAGDSVAHMKTQRYRLQSDYVLEVGTRQLNSHVTTDMWVANLPVQFATPVEASMLHPRLPGALNPVMDQIASYSTQIAAAGAPVKLVTTTTYALGSMTWETVTSTELSDIRVADVDQLSFRIPDRFKKAQQ